MRGPSKEQAGRHRRVGRADKAVRWRCPPTATPRSSAGLRTTAAGAAWVYTRSGGVWTQQGNKLVGTGAVGDADKAFGRAVRRRQHGHRRRDERQFGRRSGVGLYPQRRRWTQQGSKLVGTGAVGDAQQGFSVALSADGNTAIVGGSRRQLTRGGVGLHPQRRCLDPAGSKLVGTGAVGDAGQGTSVALSADGNTAIVGGLRRQLGRRSGVGLYPKRRRLEPAGSKLVGTGAVGVRQQGWSVALSADGNTAIVGGLADNSIRWGDVGLHPQRRRLDPAGRQAGRHRRRWNRQTRPLSRAVRRRQHRRRGRVYRQQMTGAAWVHTRKGGAWTGTPAQYLGY